jgi:macrodomain Ter protein organizer (MatP/YcbG family)
MYQLSENDRHTAVHAKAKARGQGTFTLVEQDRTAPVTIAEWIKQNIETAPDDKLRDALESALKFRRFNQRKNAD